MKMYTVDDFQSDGCQTCCCENVAAKPGTIERSHQLHPWARPRRATALRSTNFNRADADVIPRTAASHRSPRPSANTGNQRTDH